MKIIRILGGLGNQMFQYALAVAIWENCPDKEVYIDASCMNGYSLHNGYELDRIFKTQLRQASWWKLLKVAYPLPHFRLWQFGSHFLPQRRSMVTESKYMDFIPDLTTKKESLLIEGYWQTERYFSSCREALLNAFKFPEFENGSKNDRIARRLCRCESLSLHIRRGDYLKIANTSGICTVDYYEKAMATVIEKKNPQLILVFSDDPRWCEDNLKNLLHSIDAVFVDWNKGHESYRDMQLMSLCSHNIIANSSFSWWGAWLNQNPDKVVIAPSRWMNGPGWPNIIPNSWTKIEV